MIDEFQDTNTLQANIAERLASEHGNLMVVGDDSQSIYSFRGAEFRNIMDFPARHPECVITRLEQNYRSTQPILSFTNALIAQARERHEKVLFSDIPSEQKPVFLRTNTFEDQAAFVAQRVLELREEGIALDDIAILFRNGWHSNELEIELAGREIPFVKFGGMKFVETSHIKDIVALLRVLHNPRDAIAWYRQLLLIEGVGPKTAREIMEALIDEGHGYPVLIESRFQDKKFGPQLKQLHDVLAASKQAQTTEEKVAAMRAYYTPLLKSNYDDYRKRVDDLDSLERIAARYKSMQSFLDDISLEPPTHSQVDTTPEDKEEEKLVLSTIHSAKGLEWHSVFVIALIDGYLPTTQALHSSEEIEEERRLLYVACTRAAQNLYLIAPELGRSKGFSPMGPGFAFSDPSRFLTELDEIETLTEEWMLTEEE
jgi:DNA helicase-2/ATP-dependent DNA helicase PcrA